MIFKSTFYQVKPFDQSLLAGSTYGDSYAGPAPQPGPEGGFETCDAFPSEILKHAQRWEMKRQFVPMFRMCDLSYSAPVVDRQQTPFPRHGFQTKSGDVFLNVTGSNFTDYLMITQPEYILKRYGLVLQDSQRFDGTSL